MEGQAVCGGHGHSWPVVMPTLASLCVFCPTGRTYTFKNVDIVLDNETVLVFDYRAMSDGKAKRMTVYKSAIIGTSVCNA